VWAVGVEYWECRDQFSWLWHRKLVTRLRSRIVIVACGLTIVPDKGVLATFNLFSSWPIQPVVSMNGFYMMPEKLLVFFFFCDIISLLHER